jgi:hypothetical protein
MSTLKTTNLQHASAASPAIVLASDGTATAQLSSLNGGPLSGARNRIINGDMRIAQRGTTSTSNGYVSLDRWYVNQSGGSTTFSQETFAAGDEIQGISTYAKLVVSSSSDYTSIYQRVEDVRSLSGTVTLSFWAKGTAPNAGLKIFGTQNFGSGGSADVDLSAQGVSLTTTWTQYSVNIALPSIAGKTIGTSNFLQINIGQHSNTSTSAWELNITGVQLEAGSVATPFERRSYGQELALCQRYYEKSDNIAIWSGRVVSGSTYARIMVYYKVTKRATPSTITITNDDRNAFASTAPTAAATGPAGFHAYLLANATNDDGYLGINWTASAEL